MVNYFGTTIKPFLTNRGIIINFSDGAKNALARPTFKKTWQNKENYCPVSILNALIQLFLSNFVSAYRKHYSANHALMPIGKKTSTRCLFKTSKTSSQDILQISKTCLKRKSERHLRKTS